MCLSTRLCCGSSPVESIELLLQIVVDDSGSTSGPDLEEDTGAWVGGEFLAFLTHMLDTYFWVCGFAKTINELGEGKIPAATRGKTEWFADDAARVAGGALPAEGAGLQPNLGCVGQVSGRPR